MDIIQPPTSDYVPASVLTTQGDIIVRGVAAPARLAIGTTKQLLRVNDAANGLEYGPALGTSKQLLRVNAAANDLEYGPSLGSAKQIIGVNDAGNDVDYRNLTSLFAKCLIYRVGADQPVTSGVETVAQLNTVSYDTDSIANVANYRIIPNRAGYYYVNGSLNISYDATYTENYIALQKNGVDFILNYSDRDFSGAEIKRTIISGIVYCNGTGDYIDIAVYGVSASNIYINTDSLFTSLSLIGPF